MAQKRIAGEQGGKKRGRTRLFSQGARVWITVAVILCLVLFVLLPLGMNASAGANAIYVMAQRDEVRSMETPAPLLVAETTPDSRAAAPTPAPTNGVQVSQYSLLQENDDYPTVQSLQTRLMELGYLDSDEPSTVYGHATTVAVSLFQRTVNAQMDGVADSELQEALFSGDAAAYEMKLGDSGPDVTTMQSRLSELGYYTGKLSGYFGVATEDSLEAFQVKNGLESGGIFGVDDRDILYSPGARPKIDPTPTPKPTPKPTKRPSSSGGGSSGGGSSGGSGSSGSGGGSAPVVADPPASGGESPAVDTSTPSFSASYSPDGLVSVASAMVGKPYAWSQESPGKGFDCSGLVYYSLRTCGVSVSRYSASGFSAVDRWSNIGSASELSKGDLVFFKNDTSSKVSHTGIYMGGGRFVHASSSAGKVIVSSIGTPYWTRNFINGRRVF